ncbi:MAG: HDIG domain-containing protein [Myxococcales bacterium]|nr:HDIG domain-containing protein [Polyangiaceae bacterium]MDW8249142.1 HDIG domain-containing protein [Myxococcales bacterium]
MLRTRVRASVTAGVALSAVFALLFTGVGAIDILVPSWGPVLGHPTPIALRVPYSTRILRDHASTESSLSHGQLRVLIPPQTLLLEGNGDHAVAFAYESLRRPTRLTRLGAYAAIHFALGLMLTAYLRTFGHSRTRLLRTQVGLFGVMLLTMAVAKGMLLFTGLPEFWMPEAAAPLWIALSFDRRTALLVNIVLAVLIASLLRYDVLLLFVLLTRGMTATVLFFSVKRPRQMLSAGVLAGITSAAVYGAVRIVYDGTFPVLADLSKGLGSDLIACAGGGAAAGLLANLLHEPVERLLGHVSRNQLLTLSDLDHPLLMKMAREAPGSWEHARAMANLAEAAASAIGADALLTRVGAYYHDLGKTLHPKFFVENLAPGEKTPHADLPPEKSAEVILTHVVEGTKILRQGGIPESVVEFAYTHHGTQVVEFFWHKCQEQGNPKGLTEEHFRYPGMRPQTKETAILMLVDSIEAASRTIDPPEREKFEAMIQRIVFTKLRDGQLDESGLSLEDLRILTERMTSALVNAHHSRIKYPWQKQPDLPPSRPTPLLPPATTSEPEPGK